MYHAARCRNDATSQRFLPNPRHGLADRPSEPQVIDRWGGGRIDPKRCRPGRNCFGKRDLGRQWRRSRCQRVRLALSALLRRVAVRAWRGWGSLRAGRASRESWKGGVHTSVGTARARQSVRDVISDPSIIVITVDARRRKSANTRKRALASTESPESQHCDVPTRRSNARAGQI